MRAKEIVFAIVVAASLTGCSTASPTTLKSQQSIADGKISQITSGASESSLTLLFGMPFSTQKADFTISSRHDISLDSGAFLFCQDGTASKKDTYLLVLPYKGGGACVYIVTAFLDRDSKVICLHVDRNIVGFGVVQKGIVVPPAPPVQ